MGMLETVIVELLAQEILAPVAQQACKLRYLLYFLSLSLSSLHLKLSLKENVAPGQLSMCFKDCCKHSKGKCFTGEKLRFLLCISLGVLGGQSGEFACLREPNRDILVSFVPW